MFGSRKQKEPEQPLEIDRQEAISEDHAIAAYGSDDSWQQVCEYMDRALANGWEVVACWNQNAGGQPLFADLDTSIRVLYRRCR